MILLFIDIVEFDWFVECVNGVNFEKIREEKPVQISTCWKRIRKFRMIRIMIILPIMHRK